MEDKHRYDYMLNMPHHKSRKRKYMSVTDRAAQFGAFRALTGYEEAITETGRLTDKRIELDEHEKSELDRKLQYLQYVLKKKPTISVKYFVPDDKKRGGEYVTHTGDVKKIRNDSLIFFDGTEIKISDIFELNIGMQEY